MSTDRPASPLELKPDDLFVRAAYAIARPVSRYFRVSIEGLERIPRQGGVMLVSNHALMGVDTWALLPKLIREIDRVPRGLALRKLFELPLVKQTLEHAGMVAGERHSAVELLRREELVVTYPGGARDSLKDRSERYRLKWQGRLGFAHVAVQAQRPVLPIVGAGPDECFYMLKNSGVVPMAGLAAHKLKVPLFIPIARRIPFHYLVGELLHPPEIHEATRPEVYEALVQEFAGHVEQTTQALLKAHSERYQDALERPRAARRARRRGALRRLLGVEEMERT